jgi:hypothetical protein
MNRTTILGQYDITDGVRTRQLTKDANRSMMKHTEGHAQRKMAYTERATRDTKVTNSNSHTDHEIRMEKLMPLLFILGLVLFAMINA